MYILPSAALVQMNQHAGSNYSRCRFLNTVNLLTERTNSGIWFLTRLYYACIDDTVSSIFNYLKITGDSAKTDGKIDN